MKFLARTWVLFLFIVLIAGVFRVLVLQYVEFKGDEAINLLLASRFLFGHPFPPASQASSAGILNFPLLNYLLFPIVLFTLYPPAISFVIAFINVFTVGGFFLLFNKYHGKLTALFTSLIIALSPWAILYSRKIWAQDFLLPLSFPFFLSVYKIFEGKKKYWILFGISSMLLMQIHQIAIIIPFLIFLGLFKKALSSWKFLLLGLCIGLIPTIPYFLYVFSHICLTCSTALVDRLSLRSFVTFLRPLQILSIGDFHIEFGNDFALFATFVPILYQLSKLSYLAYFLMPIGIFFFWVKEKTYRMWVLAAVAYVLLLFAAGIEPLMHYYILLISLLALFIGYVLSFLVKNRKFWIIGVVLTIVYFLGLISFDSGFLLFLAKKGGLAGEYGSGYVNSEKDNQIALRAYKNLPNYKEIELLYESPIEYFHGYMPLGKMIFPFQTLKQNESLREKQFIKSPTNPLLQYPVFAYYTQSQNPSWPYIVSLKEKSRKNSVFDFLYQKELEEYLSSHLKNLYETPDFLLLYPRHWSKEEIDNGVVLTDGKIVVKVIKVFTPEITLIPQSYMKHQLSIVGKQTSEGVCLMQNKICAVLTDAVGIRANSYQLSLNPVGTDSIPNEYSKIFQEIIDSIMPLQ